MTCASACHGGQATAAAAVVDVAVGPELSDKLEGDQGTKQRHDTFEMPRVRSSRSLKLIPRSPASVVDGDDRVDKNAEGRN